MDCEDVQEWVSSSLDGRLAPREASLLAEHLDGCSDCRGRRDVMDAQRAALRERYLRLPAPPGLRAQAEAVLSGRRAEDAPAASGLPGWWLALRSRWFYLIPLGALAGFLSLIGLLAFWWWEAHRR